MNKSVSCSIESIGPVNSFNFSCPFIALGLGYAKTNILLIMTDQQAWDAVGYTGNRIIKTPNRDRLAASGHLYDKITEPNFEETTLPAMLAYSIYTAVKSGWLNNSYLFPADKMRRAVFINALTEN